MEFWDMHILNPSEESLKIAKELGFNGLCLETEINKDIINACKNYNLKCIFMGVVDRNTIINAKKYRKKYDVLAFRAKSREDLRNAIKKRFFDMILVPLSSDKKNILDYVSARICKENGIWIEISFRELITTSTFERAKIISSYVEIAKLQQKYKFNFVVTSSAINAWDLRSPEQLMRLAIVLGFDNKYIKKCVSNEIVKNSK